MRCCAGVGGRARAGQARQLPFDTLDMNEGLYVNPLQGFMTGVHLFTLMSAFWTHKDIFSLCCMLTVTCFCSFHKRARLLVCSSGRCTAIMALLWRSAGHAACCTHTKGTFPLSYFSSHQHGDEDTTITGIVLQHAASLHIHYRTTSQFGFQNLQ